MVLKKVEINDGINYPKKEETEEMSIALKNTMKALLDSGFDPNRGVYIHAGSASDINVETSMLEGKWLAIYQRLDN